MSLFTKSVANVYVDEIRRRMDERVIAMFPPDTMLQVGDFGSFEDGRFSRKGTLTTRGFWFEPPDPLARAGDPHATKVDVDEHATASFEFASDGKVDIGATSMVTGIGGAALARAVVAFKRKRAVVASFSEGRQRAPSDADRFADRLLDLWKRGELPPNRLVVSEVRRSRGGTVLISSEGGSSVEVLVDPSRAPSGVSVASLQAGVNFGAERKAVWKLSTDDELTVSVKLLGYASGAAKDVFGFDTSLQPPPGSIAAFSNEHLLSLLGGQTGKEL